MSLKYLVLVGVDLLHEGVLARVLVQQRPPGFELRISRARLVRDPGFGMRDAGCNLVLVGVDLLHEGVLAGVLRRAHLP